MFLLSNELLFFFCYSIYIYIYIYPQIVFVILAFRCFAPLN